MVDRRGSGFEIGTLFVAIAAGRGNVAAGERKRGLFVPRQGETGRPVSFQVMTALTTVEIGSGGKLARMLIAVAVSAVLELDLE